MGDVDGAQATFDRALQIARETGLPKEEADWHKGKGTTLVGLGRYDAALHEYAAAEQVYERSGLQRELVEALNDTGHLYELLGDGVAADTRFHHALQLAQKIGNGSGESTSLLALGGLERRRKKNDAADTYFGRALERAREVGDEGSIVVLLLFFCGRLSVLDFLSLARKPLLPDACPKTVYQTYATFLFRSTLETLQWDGTKPPHFLFPSSKGHGQTLALRSHDQPPAESCHRRVGKIASPKKGGSVHSR